MPRIKEFIFLANPSTAFIQWFESKLVSGCNAVKATNADSFRIGKTYLDIAGMPRLKVDFKTGWDVDRKRVEGWILFCEIWRQPPPEGLTSERFFVKFSCIKDETKPTDKQYKERYGDKK